MLGVVAIHQGLHDLAVLAIPVVPEGQLDRLLGTDHAQQAGALQHESGCKQGNHQGKCIAFHGFLVLLIFIISGKSK